MPRKVTCPHCNKDVMLADAFSAPQGRCPWCKGLFPVNAPDASAGTAPSPIFARAAAEGALTCSQCLRLFRLPPQAMGRRIACPHCRTPHAVMGEPSHPILVPDTATENDSLPSLAPIAAAGALPLPGSGGTVALPIPGEKARASRFRATGAAAAPVGVEVVIQTFFCESSPATGEAVAREVKALLEKEECFRSIAVSDNPDALGTRFTVEGGMASPEPAPGGHALLATAKLLDSGHGETPLSSRVQWAGDRSEPLLQANAKLVAKPLALEVLKRQTGRTYLADDLRSTATTACVLGCLSFIPAIGMILYLISVILSLIVFFRNRNRITPIGKRRVITGLAIGLAGVIFGVWALNQ